MKTKVYTSMLILMMGILAACGNGTENGNKEETDELATLEVEFQLPEKAEADEIVELKAIVTYGDEKVKDADEVQFEYWVKGNEDDTEMVESTNNGDGTYTAEVFFESDGVYEIYAHTTARNLHTMPKKSITVGEGTSQE
ncbi:FixH family protein [Salinicoccus sp. ID82-1]|uniref:FixH family protein n=1 Tax=Salinicoccus sp. ID82-1 TaxID=2820269 RepID=UPI001F2C2609|nr:FixH family protein [Salinicoccus sp. ID82-1]MCG1010933.1 FixH family protein [Salinicoccus sp. ID82-1]